MNTSEETDQINKALCESQAAFPKIPKSKTVSTGKYSYSYADLADVLDAIRPVLVKHGIAVVQAPDVDMDSGRMFLRSRLAHRSGQWVESVYPLPSGASAQEMGSALTYARRYSLSALTGIAAEDDDDGQRAGRAKVEPRTRTAAPATSSPSGAQSSQEPRDQEAGGPVADATTKALLIPLRKRIKQGHPDDPEVLDGSIQTMTLAGLQARWPDMVES